MGGVGAAGNAGAAHIVKATRHQHTARPLLRELTVRGGKGLWRNQSVFTLERQINSLIRTVIEIHAPIWHHAEAQTGSIIKLCYLDVLSTAAQKPRFTDTRDLLHIPQLFQQFNLHKDSLVSAGGHSGVSSVPRIQYY